MPLRLFLEASECNPFQCGNEQTMDRKHRLAGIELGGTKSIAILASGTDILETATFQTRRPEETLPLLREQLQDWHRSEGFDAIGIASFGPLQLSRSKPGYGAMLKTPKPFWSGVPIAAEITAPFSCPWTIDTDVNGAGLAEYLWGAGAGCESICYITIGTGLGGGLVIQGRAVHGASGNRAYPHPPLFRRSI
jgi:fructokinase